MTYNSTVLVQAAILGKTLITHSLSSPVYPMRFGLDLHNFKSRDEFEEIIKSAKKQDIKKLGIDNKNLSSEKIIKFIKKII